MEQATWQTILSTALIGIVPMAITLIVSWLRSKITKWMKAIDNPVVNELRDKLNIYLDGAINATNNQFVDKLKATGTWDTLNGVFDKDVYSKNAAEAKSLCYGALIASLPINFKNSIEHYFTDIKSYLLSEIDRRINERKKEQTQNTTELEEVL